jgi:hypothetical protein
MSHRIARSLSAAARPAKEPDPGDIISECLSGFVGIRMEWQNLRDLLTP